LETGVKMTDSSHGVHGLRVEPPEGKELILIIKKRMTKGRYR
jgi:hypothetical protein